MSKTLRSRIAAVAVGVLGAGLLTAAPANAAASLSAALSVSAPSLNRASSTGTITLTVKLGSSSDSVGAVSGDQFTARVISVPAGADANSPEVGDMFGSGNPASTTDTVSTSITFGAANTCRKASTNVTCGSVGTNNSTYAVGYRTSEGTANLNVGDSLIGGLDINGDGDYGDTVAGVDEYPPSSVTNDYINVAGSYSIGVWYDENADGVLDSGIELTSYKVITFVVGGTPTTITLTPASTSISSGVDSYIKMYVTDAAGNNTKLNAGESIALTLASLTGSATNLLTVEGASASGTATDTADSTDTSAAITALRTYIKVWINSSAGGTVRVTANFLGTLTPLSTASSSGTITVAGRSYASALEITTTGLTTNQYKYLATSALEADATASVTDTVFASAVANRVVAFKITGTPGSYVPVALSSVTDASLTLTAGTSSVLIGADGTATYTLSPTSVNASTAFTVTVPSSASFNLAFTVNFDAPTIDCNSASNCPISATGIPRGVTKTVSAVGATSTYTVTVKDQFGTAYSNYVAKLTTTSTNRNASKAVQAVTGTDGKATVAFTDASTSTTNTTDNVTIAVYAPSDLTTNLFGYGNAIAISYVGTLGTLAVAGGSTATAPVRRTVPASDTLSTTATTGSAVALTDTLLDSTGGAVSGYGVTYTGTDGVWFLADANGNGTYAAANDGYLYDALQTLTVANGTTVFAIGTKTGTATVTVNGGGLTKTATFTVLGAADRARNIAYVSASVAGTTGVTSTVSATVTDGWGNAVEGASVTFVRSGGRFLAGASSVTVVTDVNGLASADLTSDSAGAVTITAEITNASQATTAADRIADMPVYGFTAASGKQSATVTFAAAVVTKSAAELAAEAAKAAADAAKAEAAKATAAVEAAKIAAAADAAKAALALEAVKAAAAADAAKAALAIEAAKAEAAKATTEAAKATAAIAAVSATVTSVQTAISTLVASVTATLTAMSAQIAKIMKKLNIK